MLTKGHGPIDAYVEDFVEHPRRARCRPRPHADRVQSWLMIIARLPAAHLIVHTLVQDEIHARSDAYDNVAIVARITAEKTEVVLDQNGAMLQRLAERPLVMLLDSDQCDPLIDAYFALHRNYTNIGIRDLRAKIACSHIDNPPAQADVARFRVSSRVFAAKALSSATPSSAARRGAGCRSSPTRSARRTARSRASWSSRWICSRRIGG